MYLEDFPVGTRWNAGEFTMTAEEALDFARKYDPQPMHVDADAAAKGRFGELIASGWHTAALTMKALAEAKLLGETEMLGLGVDQILWPVPVRHGDVLRVDAEVIANTPSKSKPDHGVIKCRTIVENQKGEVVMSLTSNLWVPRRPV